METTTPQTDPDGTRPARDPRARCHALVDVLPPALLAPLADWLEAELAYRMGRREAAPRGS